MNYADKFRRQAEIRSKLGDTRLSAIIGAEVERRRAMASAWHLAHRVQRMRHTAFIDVDGRRV